MDYKFNAKETTEKLITGIREWFKINGSDCVACVAMSGGKDSTIVAKLCVEALGADRVYGFGLPDNGQGLNDADEIADWLGIHFSEVPIHAMTEAINDGILNSFLYSSKNDSAIKITITNQTRQNIPPRIRMTVLYALSQSLNGRVIGTCNASENYIGYFTKYGDGASDFEPIAELTVHELYQVGDELGIPRKWTYKTPDDGLPHSMPDDEKFEKKGFNYAKLDAYIRKGTSGDEIADAAIEKMHNQNLFKLKPVEVIKI